MTFRTFLRPAAAPLAGAILTSLGLTSLGLSASAAEPTILAAPTAAISQAGLETLALDTSAAVPTAAELQRLKNELRFQVQGSLRVSLGQSFERALDDADITKE